MCIKYASAMQIRQPTLSLKPRGDVIRNPKQGYQWPQNRTHVSAKYYKKTNKILYNEIIEFICIYMGILISHNSSGQTITPFLVPIENQLMLMYILKAKLY